MDERRAVRALSSLRIGRQRRRELICGTGKFSSESVPGVVLGPESELDGSAAHSASTAAFSFMILDPSGDYLHAHARRLDEA